MTEPLRLAFAPDGRFVASCAGVVLDQCAERLPDLSGVTVVVPRAAWIPVLRGALGAVAGTTLLLPAIRTLDDLSLSAPAAGEDLRPLPAGRRAFELYRQIRERGWFESQGRWPLCAELVGLFDELTEAAIPLADDERQFLARLERAYRLRDSVPLRFEARLVHALWRAEVADGRSGAALRARALARLAQQAEGPLFVIADAPLTPAAEGLLSRWATAAPAVLISASRLAGGDDARLAVCNAAWPVPASAGAEGEGGGAGEAVLERAAGLAACWAHSPLAPAVALQPAASLEALAQSVCVRVRRWLGEGRQRIALVAADRVAARRVRALLERERILVLDETGWRLSTTRAGALVNALLEVVAADAWYRDLLDLLKSPFVFADQPVGARRLGVLAIERSLRRHNLRSGLRRFEEAVRREEGEGRLPPSPALELLRQVRAAAARLPRSAAVPAVWIGRLLGALEALRARELLAADAAGARLLELLAERRDELQETGVSLDFAEWREWLGRELDETLFRDRGIDSPVVMTPLETATLRPFEAVVVIGADAANLRPAVPAGLLGNPAVRAELGLGTAQQAQRLLEDRLAALICGVPQVVFAWQSLREGEPNLLAPVLERLAVLHRAAWGEGLVQPLAHAPETPAPRAAPGSEAPAPVAPPGLLPGRVSASGYASLVACPYQFHARRVLRLAEQAEVREALEKRDYGDILHAILQQFHARHPVLTGQPEAELCAALEAISREAFARAVEENFLEHAWLSRWLRRVPAYVAWQQAHEAAGWRFDAAELQAGAELLVDDGPPLMLEGRLDRVDRAEGGDGAGALAVLDYKTQSAGRLRKRLEEPDGEVQLPFYLLLLQGRAQAAAFVALDDEPVADVPMEDAAEAAAAQAERLAGLFARLRAGDALPANGSTAACAWCEMRGLCRRDWWRDGAPGAGRGEAA